MKLLGRSKGTLPMNVDVNGFEATGIKSMEFHSTNTSDQTMKLLGKSRDTLPTDVSIVSPLKPNRTDRVQLFGCP